MIADIYSSLQTPAFIQFLMGALVAGGVYLLCVKIYEKMTSGLVRKSELKKSFDDFKVELLKELVTAKDLQLFKLEQEAGLEKALKETRHSLANSLNDALLPVTDKLERLQIDMARVTEHFQKHS